MRTFSRWLPNPPQASLRWPWVALGSIGLLVAGWFLGQLTGIAFAVAALALLGSLLLRDFLRVRRLLRTRPGESFCTLVRALPRAQRDPWVLRALHDELAAALGCVGHRLPLRPTDRLLIDLGLDAEALEEIIEDAAKRSQRSLATAESNPFYGRVQTVGDMLGFLVAQPRVPAT